MDDITAIELAHIQEELKEKIKLNKTVREYYTEISKIEAMHKIREEKGDLTIKENQIKRDLEKRKLTIKYIDKLEKD